MEERERIVSYGPISDEEKKFDLNLRPKRLKGLIGQANLVEKLEISILAAKKREEPLEHVLFHGPPGLGKTTIAHIIAGEMGTNFYSTSGPALERAGDLIGIMTNLEYGDVLFIDEIHRIPKIIEEYIYPAMEEFKIDFIVDKGPFAKAIKMTLKPFTLIGATTRAGSLSAPLRERFGIFHHLDFYGVEDLEKIVLRTAGILDIKIKENGAREIARRARGTPRIANRLLRRVRDYAEVRADGIISDTVADEALKMEGIDGMGLDEFDRKLISTIIRFYNGGPVGVEALSATLNEEVDTLVDMVEPYLLKTGFLQRTRAGRVVSERAKEYWRDGGGVD
jgi:holliday junction DNA helicase RuvB